MKERDMIEITHEPLDPKAVTARVMRDTNGAVVTFLGVTRNFTGERRVLHLEYEAYRPMADAKLHEIADDIRTRWEIEDVAIAHRLGRLEVGETSLVVAVASPHRAEAFAACRFLIEEVKRRAPVWKKEHYVSGKSEWVSGCALKSRPKQGRNGMKRNLESPVVPV